MDWWLNAPGFGYRPSENEVLGMAIGQGPNAQTPLRMAQFYAAVGRDDGTAPAPRLAQFEDRRDSEPTLALNASVTTLEAMREGLREVTSASGTAFRASLEHWDLIGKTGTAQVQDQELNNAWFLGLAGPWGSPPEVVVAVMIEEGDSGSRVAAPIASKAVDFYLRGKYGIEPDSIQTLGEHLDRGISPPWARWSAVPRASSEGVGDDPTFDDPEARDPEARNPELARPDLADPALQTAPAGGTPSSGRGG
jgi:penicillin-binding protein 2